jgi:hypothetical protein
MRRNVPLSRIEQMESSSLPPANRFLLALHGDLAPAKLLETQKKAKISQRSLLNGHSAQAVEPSAQHDDFRIPRPGASQRADTFGRRRRKAPEDTMPCCFKASAVSSDWLAAHEGRQPVSQKLQVAPTKSKAPTETTEFVGSLSPASKADLARALLPELVGAIRADKQVLAQIARSLSLTVVEVAANACRNNYGGQ